MKRNVFVFHGTGGSPEGNWFPWLKEKLEKEHCQVFVLKFPNPEKPSLKDWFAEFEKYKEYVNQDTILVGHSLGGLFILRVLEKLKTPIYATFIVAAPVGVKPIRYYESDYRFSQFTFNWKKIKQNARHFKVYHSDNDPYVSLGNGEELAKQVGVTLTFIPNAGHLNAESDYETFDELLADIKVLL